MPHYRTFVCAAAVVLPLWGSCFAQPCSQATVRGTWAHQSRLTAMVNIPGSSTPVPVPFAGLGIMTIDYQGRYIDRATASVGGQMQELEVPGTIQVSPDCTGTDTWTFGGEEMTGRFVIVDNGNEMRYIPTKFPPGPMVGISYMRRLWPGEPPQCASGMVRGVYAGSREGTYMVPIAGESQPVPTPFSAVHTAIFQYDGNGTALSTVSLGGAIADFESPRVSMQVNPDCTALMSWSSKSKQFPGQTFTGRVKYIVLNHGDELWGLETENSATLPIVVENMKRISMTPAPLDR